MRTAIACFLLTAAVCAQSAITVRVRSRQHDPNFLHPVVWTHPPPAPPAAPAQPAPVATGALAKPVVSNITASGFTVSWTTSQALNTQLHYGAGNLLQRYQNWKLSTRHTAVVAGLQPGTAYSIEAESSYYADPDLLGPGQTVTTLAAVGGTNGGSSGGTGGTGSSGASGGSSTAAGLDKPAVSNISTNGFTVSWTTSQALNTQLHYGAGNLGLAYQSWKLTTQHTVALTGLQPGTPYTIQAESSYFADPDLHGPGQTVTTLAAAGGTGGTSGTGGTGGTAGSGGTGGTAGSGGSNNGARLFPSPSANWLYSAPTGTGLNISSITRNMKVAFNTHAGGFDYPVQYTDGTHGCTNFTDTLQYNYTDHYCVPNPANGYHPSVGGWGANDGHVVVVDTATRMYYDFWKLYVDANGNPKSTNVGGIARGSLDGNGTPGHTAAEITGLAGDILPGELDCVTCLNHALNCVVPGSMNSNLVGHQAPAMKTDGGVRGAIFREGAKLQFDPSINVNTLNASTAVKALLRAMQLYGAVITDQSGSSNQIGCYTALATRPDTTGIGVAVQHMFLFY